MPSLWFVTPAHGRFGMTAICLEQRRRTIEQLAERGIDAGCVVVSDDRNTAIAEELGFAVVWRDNKLFGRRWNDGIEWACREAGADYIVPIGTDDWVQADELILPAAGTIRTSARLAIVEPRGREIAGLQLKRAQPHNAPGYIPWIIPRPLLEPVGFRPARDELQQGADGSIANGIIGRRRRVRFVPHDGSWLQAVDFKSRRDQLTSYRRTVACNPVERRASNPFELLADEYPTDLCERMERLYHPRKGARR